MDQLTPQQSEIVEKLKERYSQIHPVIFQRMIERAKNEFELFDILDTVPESFPLVFDVSARRLTRAVGVLRKQG